MLNSSFNRIPSLGSGKMRLTLVWNVMNTLLFGFVQLVGPLLVI